MIYYILLSIFVLYILFVFLKDGIYKVTKQKICALCAAVSLTWLTLLALNFFGYKIDSLILAILMGESVTGIAYLLDKRIKNKLYLSLLRLFTIIFGTLAVYLILGLK
ncbi:hypothetical protein HYX16_06620 [Candidatus Woesearchaeota archaeon]|nr:hypothetical protein [Candidatus Woesearchaeota archaeon]